MIVLTDTGFYAKEGDLSNLKVCQRGTWNDLMMIETVFSMLTLVSHFKKIPHRVWAYFKACLAYTVTTFNILVQWRGLVPDEQGRIHLSIAQVSL